MSYTKQQESYMSQNLVSSLISGLVSDKVGNGKLSDSAGTYPVPGVAYRPTSGSHKQLQSVAGWDPDVLIATLACADYTHTRAKGAQVREKSHIAALAYINAHGGESYMPPACVEAAYTDPKGLTETHKSELSDILAQVVAVATSAPLSLKAE